MKTGQKNTSNKAIYQSVAEATGISHRDVKDVFRGVIHFIGDELNRGNPVCVHGFGVFKLGTRKGRTLTWTNHPTLGTRTSVQPDSKIIKFKPSLLLKARLNPKLTKNVG